MKRIESLAKHGHRWPQVVFLSVLVSLPLLLLFQNFSSIDHPIYDEALGLCVDHQNGNKVLGAHGSNPMKPCGLWIGGDFSKRDMHGLHLTGTTILGSHSPEINLRGAMLKGITAQQSFMMGADLSAATIEQSEFHDTNISNTNFSSSVIRRTAFNRLLSKTNEGAAASGFMPGNNADFSSTQMEGVAFWSVDLQHANFQSAKLDFGLNPSLTLHSKTYRALFENVNASGANFARATLSHGQLANLSFQNAKFHEAQITDSIWCGKIDWTNADLSSSQLQNIEVGTVPCRAQETLIELSRANLQGSNIYFSGLATTAKIKMDGANLKGANMAQMRTLANLKKRVSFRGAIYDKNTQLPFDETTAKLMGMRKVK